MDFVFIEEEHLYLNSVIQRLYGKKLFYKGKMQELSDEIYSFVKSIIGEKSKRKLLSVLIYSFLKVVKSARNSMYKVINTLTIKQESKESKNIDFKCLLLKPYKKNEKKFMSFLRIIMTNFEIFKKAAELLNPIVEFLKIENRTLDSNFEFSKLSKIAFYGVIYNNPLIKECLGEIDRNGPGPQIVINSNYETSSEDSFTVSQTIRYEARDLHNFFNISEGDKAQWTLFMLQVKCISTKSIQIIKRHPGDHHFYKLFFTPELSDPYGVK
mmetsp:Transcript_10306/g.11540  ORF Transcript_10306/g.11540 Transcript_10306/m.11540 type:complete len:269 (-) Transcript_10306:567-1373(-)